MTMAIAQLVVSPEDLAGVFEALTTDQEIAAERALELGRQSIRARGGSGLRGNVSTPAQEALDGAARLVIGLRSEEESVRAGVAMALGELGGGDVVGELADALAREPSERVAGHLIRALRTIGGEEALWALCAAIESGHRAATGALEELALGVAEDYTSAPDVPDELDGPVAERLFDRLLQAASASETGAREDIVELASRIRRLAPSTSGNGADDLLGPPAEPELAQPDVVPQLVVSPEDLAGVFEALTTDQEIAAERALELGRQSIRARGGSGLRGNVSTPAQEALDGAARLVIGLRSEEESVRAGVAMALGELGGGDVVGELADALAREPSERVAGHLIRALRTIGGEEALWALCAAIESGHRAATGALEELALGVAEDYTSAPDVPDELDGPVAERLFDRLLQAASASETGAREDIVELASRIRRLAPSTDDPVLVNQPVPDSASLRLELIEAGRRYAIRVDPDERFGNIDIHLDDDEDRAAPLSVSHAFGLRPSGEPPVLHLRELRATAAGQAVTEYLVKLGPQKKPAYYVARPALPIGIGPRYQDANHAAELALAASATSVNDASIAKRQRQPKDRFEDVRVALREDGPATASQMLERLVRSARKAGQLDSAAQLEIARFWSREIGDSEQATALYRDLVSALKSEQNAARRLALARYRLGEIHLRDGDVELAVKAWKAAFQANDEHVSPYAARNLATLIGTRLLPAERVLGLYVQAANSAHLGLAAQASLEYADFLARRHQYHAARRQLEDLRDNAEAVVAAKADQRLRLLAVEERAAPQYLPTDDAVSLDRKALDYLIPRMAGGERERVVIVGAGLGGQYLFEAYMRSADRPVICGFVDDDPQKILPDTFPLLGNTRTEDLARVIRDHRVDKVVLAIPTASGDLKRRVLEACWRERVPLVRLPSMHDLQLGWTKNQSLLLSQLRDVPLHELLGRNDVAVDHEAIDWVRGATVLVLGAKGLAAELCRRLADARVHSLTVIDPDAERLAQLAAGLARRDFHNVSLREIDHLDRELLRYELDSHQPDIVINAAAVTSDAAAERSAYAARRDVLAAHAVAEAAGEAGIPLVVHVSDIRADGRSTYAQMKLLSEDVIFLSAEAYPATRFVVARTRPVVGTEGSILNTIATRVEDARFSGDPLVQVPAGQLRLLSMTRAAELLLHVARLSRDGTGASLYALDAGAEATMTDVTGLLIRYADYGDDELSVRARKERVAEGWDVGVGHAVAGMPEIVQLDQSLPARPDVQGMIELLKNLPSHVGKEHAAPLAVVQALENYGRTARRPLPAQL